MFERFINKIHSQNDNQLSCPQLNYCHEHTFIGDARLRYTHRKGLLATMVAREQVERRSVAVLVTTTVMTQSVSQTLSYAIVHNEKQILKSNLMSLSIELVWSTLLSLCQAQLECINTSHVHIVTKGYNLNIINKH